MEFQSGNKPFLHPIAELQGTFSNANNWRVVMDNSHPNESQDFFVRALCMVAMP
jgi:hypothetical protein